MLIDTANSRLGQGRSPGVVVIAMAKLVEAQHVRSRPNQAARERTSKKSPIPQKSNDRSQRVVVSMGERRRVGKNEPLRWEAGEIETKLGEENNHHSRWEEVLWEEKEGGRKQCSNWR